MGEILRHSFYFYPYSPWVVLSSESEWSKGLNKWSQNYCNFDWSSVLLPAVTYSFLALTWLVNRSYNDCNTFLFFTAQNRKYFYPFSTFLSYQNFQLLLLNVEPDEPNLKDFDLLQYWKSYLQLSWSLSWLLAWNVCYEHNFLPKSNKLFQKLCSPKCNTHWILRCKTSTVESLFN